MDLLHSRFETYLLDEEEREMASESSTEQANKEEKEQKAFPIGFFSEL